MLERVGSVYVCMCARSEDKTDDGRERFGFEVADQVELSHWADTGPGEGGGSALTYVWISRYLLGLGVPIAPFHGVRGTCGAAR